MTRSGVVQFRVSPSERERLDALAAKAGVRLSDWVRSRALEEAPGTLVATGTGSVTTRRETEAAAVRTSSSDRPASPRAPETPESAQRREKALMADLRRNSAPAYQRPFNPRPKGS